LGNGLSNDMLFCGRLGGEYGNGISVDHSMD
jgi:hypothetical protein